MWNEIYELCFMIYESCEAIGKLKEEILFGNIRIKKLFLVWAGLSLTRLVVIS